MLPAWPFQRGLTREPTLPHSPGLILPSQSLLSNPARPHPPCWAKGLAELAKGAKHVALSLDVRRMSVSARVSKWNVPGRQGHAASFPDVPRHVAWSLEPASLQLDRGDGQAAEARGNEGERSLETIIENKGSGTFSHHYSQILFQIENPNQVNPSGDLAVEI